jgi:ketosteroid isomerase-like protein
MHTNAALITRFYTAFSRRDHAAMAACYHPQAHFIDAVFDLHGAQVGAMWRMLCERGTDLRLDFREVAADDRLGSAHWEAWYSFSATGRKVHNVIEASFEFQDGLILRHRDAFSFWRWSRQALGAPGLLLGWSGFLRRKVQATAAQGLEKFSQASPQAADRAA